jgi:hypothetical protein
MKFVMDVHFDLPVDEDQVAIDSKPFDLADRRVPVAQQHFHLVGEDGVATLANLAVVLLGRRIMMIETHDRPSVVLLLDPFD